MTRYQKYYQLRKKCVNIFLKCVKVVSPHLRNVWYKGVKEEDCMSLCYGEAMNDGIQFWGEMSNLFRLLKYNDNVVDIALSDH